MKTELFGGSQDGKPIELKGHMPLTIKIPVVPDLIARIEDPNDDPAKPFEMQTLSYQLDIDGKYKAEDMSR
jgi:hypothetical protein